MKKLILILTTSFVLFSCSTSKNFKNNNLTAINSSFNANYYAINSSVDSAKSSIQLLQLFRLSDANVSSVSISFDKDNNFKIRYKNFLGGSSYNTFKGKFKKNYYEIFLEKNRNTIPLIYSKTEIDRIRIRIMKDSTLVVENYYNHSGSVFLMAAGSSNKTYALFKKCINK
jgi:hypothetical protein